jgi:hypothetical protein
MQNNFQPLSDVRDIIIRVNSNPMGVFSRIPEPIVILGLEISEIIGDDCIHISEFIIAKIKGRISQFNGHPEITDEILSKLLFNLSNPLKILFDKRSHRKYLFVASSPEHIIVVEIRRRETGKTEINTIYPVGEKEQRRLGKFPIAYCPDSGGTPTPSCMPRP